MDIKRNTETILTGCRIIPNQPIIFSEYLEDGNFILLTKNYEYPDYTKFGTDQTLVFASQNEIDNL
jgi:hypothetical protein